MITEPIKELKVVIGQLEAPAPYNFPFNNF